MSDSEKMLKEMADKVGSIAVVLGPGAKGNNFIGTSMKGYENAVVTISHDGKGPEGNSFIGATFDRGSDNAGQTIYNMSGDNARVNNNSIDCSTNTVSKMDEISRLLSRLRDEISTSVLSEFEKRQALELVDGIESESAAAVPKRTVLKTLVSALPRIDSILSIGASIAALLQL